MNGALHDDDLQDGDADLAISAEDELPGGENLHRRVLLRDSYATGQRREHPRGTAPLDLDAFCAADHLIVSDSASFEGMIDTALHVAGRTRRVVLSVHSYLIAPLVASRNDLLVTLPRQLLARQEPALGLFEPPLRLADVALKAFWHVRTHDDPVNRWRETACSAMFLL